MDGLTLAFDGADWVWGANGLEYPRAAGPMTTTYQIDFDCNRNQDEMLVRGGWYDTWYVWRLAKVADLPSPYPSWWPPCNAPCGGDKPSFFDTATNQCWTWGYYNENCTSQADVYVHPYYYEKLIEDRVADSQGLYKYRKIQNFDVGGDWREEVFVITKDDLTIYYDDKPNPSAPAHSSPNYSYDYRLAVNKRSSRYPSVPIEYDNLAPVPAGSTALLSLPLNDSTAGVQGETPLAEPQTITYVNDGVSGSAMSFGSGDFLKYSAAELNAPHGSFECWVRPHWSFDENSGPWPLHVLVDWSQTTSVDEGGILFKKHNRIQFFTRVNGSAHTITEVLDSTWDSQTWHHVAATWGPHTGMRLYLDGELVAQRDVWVEPVAFPADFIVGNSRLPSGDYLNSVDADVDSVFIADYPRSRLQIAQDASGALPLLRVAFENGLTGQQGEIGTTEQLLPSVAGRIDQGIHIAPQTEWTVSTNRFSYPTEDNILPEQGTIGLWVKPDWSYTPSGQPGYHTAFHWYKDDGQDQNQIKITFKDQKKIFFLWQKDGTIQKVQATLDTTWDGQTWHYIAMTWDTTGNFEGFVDGSSAGTKLGGTLSGLEPTFYLGSDRNGAELLHSVVDGLVLFDHVRSALLIAEDAKLRSTAAIGP